MDAEEKPRAADALLGSSSRVPVVGFMKGNDGITQQRKNRRSSHTAGVKKPGLQSHAPGLKTGRLGRSCPAGMEPND
jgi:hypothetical protein